MKNCKNCRYKGRPTYIDPCAGCHEFDKFELKSTTTNADRIRAMSDEELAEFLANMLVENRMWDFVPPGHNFTATQSSATKHTWFCTLYKWLKQPVEE